MPVQRKDRRHRTQRRRDREKVTRPDPQRRAARERPAQAGLYSSPCARQDRENRGKADRERAYGSIRRCKCRPGGASASNRAATFTPSPMRLSPSARTSPRLMPIRNRIRSRPGTSAWSSVDRQLNVGGAAHCFHGAGELGDDTVAGVAENSAMVVSDQTVDDLTGGLQPRKRCLLIVAHQPAIADDVSCKDSGSSLAERRKGPYSSRGTSLVILGHKTGERESTNALGRGARLNQLEYPCWSRQERLPFRPLLSRVYVWTTSFRLMAVMATPARLRSL